MDGRRKRESGISVPPVLRDVGKLAAGVARVSAAGNGSATGNPRNKCALQPGHSLMDWIRLGSSGKDLTGVGADAGWLRVTPNELSQHDKETDAWLSLRGKVYNVTHYLPFHPGGKEELMKGVGKDATALFDRVHPWVNYDSILQKCHVGRLVSVHQGVVDAEGLFERPQSKTVDSLRGNSPKRKTPLRVKSAAVTNVTNETPPESPVHLPRFDWIQKMDSIHLFLYTQSFSNPYVQIAPPGEQGRATVHLLYDGRLFLNEVAFFGPVRWPWRTKCVGETGKVELHVEKASGGVWENYGVLRQRTRTAEEAEGRRVVCRLVRKVAVTHNAVLMEWERVDGVKTVVPVGNHVKVFGRIGGEEFVRSYTPVPRALFGKFAPRQFATDNVCLMVKRYPEGNVSRLLCDKDKGDTVEMSHPLGSFELRNLENRETFLILAAGTGITPMLGLILFLLDRRIRKCQSITLMFFNKTEGDILFRDKLQGLQNETNSLFQTVDVLSEPSEGWTGHTGRVRRELLEETVRRHIGNTGYVQSDVFFAVCGPKAFSESCDNLLGELGVGREQVHIFLG